jgi:hypothetical protein
MLRYDQEDSADLRRHAVAVAKPVTQMAIARSSG